MASTSASRGGDGATGRIRSAASSMSNETIHLFAEIRKALIMMKEVAVDLEKDNQFDKVKELEVAALELLASAEDCQRFSSVLESVGNGYTRIFYCHICLSLSFTFVWKISSQLTDFKKLFDDEAKKLDTTSSSNLQNHQLLRQFREAVWNVHHAGQPMPGEEQEDIVMTSTQCTLLNITCPLSGKPITEIADPVRSVACKHIYDKKAIMQFIRSKKGAVKCPVAACPSLIVADGVIRDSLLLIEIDELRSMSKNAIRPEIVEDFTELMKISREREYGQGLSIP
ncbi:Zinc finger, MIZ-type [Dillenia turbinata]|uniref:Zinc finger, MIZ-type n=1 Tax=Dillenia turbinata TaxID=194707 RepID=A0AAN8VR86_9MAGN